MNDIRELLKEQVVRELENVPKLLAQIKDPVVRLEMMTRLLVYLPRDFLETPDND